MVHSRSRLQFMCLWHHCIALAQCDDGTEEMRGVSDPIREGAEGFLHVQYTVGVLSLMRGLIRSHLMHFLRTVGDRQVCGSVGNTHRN